MGFWCHVCRMQQEGAPADYWAHGEDEEPVCEECLSKAEAEELEERVGAGECARCLGQLLELGRLGGMTWLRCRSCGMDYHRLVLAAEEA